MVRIVRRGVYLGVGLIRDKLRCELDGRCELNEGGVGLIDSKHDSANSTGPVNASAKHGLDGLDFITPWYAPEEKA
jgi:hypothetical protein